MRKAETVVRKKNGLNNIRKIIWTKMDGGSKRDNGRMLRQSGEDMNCNSPSIRRRDAKSGKPK